ncbi:MAG: hypothetical protein PHZ09_11550 [Eubacteriales bacterium]|jgi:hypothetical protein|nr:hypothetical protein [Eubacteriales bacterium]
MKKLNPEHINALLELINCGPYFELLNMKVLELGTGCSKAEVELHRKHFNPFGTMILKGKQSIEHAIEVMGYRTLPPKFID